MAAGQFGFGSQVIGSSDPGTVLTAINTLLNTRRVKWHCIDSGSMRKWEKDDAIVWSLTKIVLWNRSSGPSGGVLLKNWPCRKGGVKGSAGFSLGRRRM